MLRADLRIRPLARGQALKYRILAQAELGPRYFEVRPSGLFKARHITNTSKAIIGELEFGTLIFIAHRFAQTIILGRNILLISRSFLFFDAILLKKNSPFIFQGCHNDISVICRRRGFSTWLSLLSLHRILYGFTYAVNAFEFSASFNDFNDYFGT